MKFEPLFSFYGDLANPIDLGSTPYGHRMIVEVKGGAFEGEKLKGTIRPLSGGEWATVYEDHIFLDVRLTFETHDGACIYVEYTGRAEITENLLKALSGEDAKTEFGETYFFTNPRMQTGDERYKWVNSAFCVAQGRALPNRVEYNVYQVVN